MGALRPSVPHTGSGRTRYAVAAAGAAALFAAFVPATGAGPAAAAGPRARHPHPSPEVTSRTDAATDKLDAPLQRAAANPDGSTVAVMVTVRGSASAVQAQLSGDHTARAKAAGLVVGRIDDNRLVKLAQDKNVVSVKKVSLKRDGRPVASDEHPDISLKGADKRAAVDGTRRGNVPYDKAPAPRGSTFDKFKKLDVLDAKTHDFTDAWNRGLTGEGTSVAVFDSGTDWSHPDLLGAKIQRRADGWPDAYDPFGTLQLLAAPEQIDEGLSWYTPTTAASCDRHGRSCKIDYATATGPSRNLPNAPGTSEHTYTFPRSWSKSGEVRLGSHPDDYALDFFGERPAFLVTDPHTAGVYDTIYVDLDDDHDFSDEKPVTKESPRSWRDLDGDGYVDLSGGMAYYVSDGTGPSGTPLPGGPEEFGVAQKYAPGAMVAWTGDFDPPLEGHGTSTASNVVGQGVTNGDLPTFRDIPGGKFPAAVVGGAPKATMVPFGDIYFSFDFSTQFSYLLANDKHIDVTSNSYGPSEVDNDGLDAMSQEDDIWHAGGDTTSIYSTGNGGPGYGTTSPPSPVSGVKVGASTQYGATGWDSITKYSQVNDNDVANWSNRGPGSTGSNGVDLVADGAYSAGSVNLGRAVEEGKNGKDAWETWGGTSRSTPVVAGATALVYQAYRRTHDQMPEDFWRLAKGYLKSGANDLEYDGYTQGAGSLDVGRSTRIAEGTSGARVSPDEWRPGDYQGKEYDAFPHLVAPGGTDSQQFTLDGSGRYDVSDRTLRRVGVEKFDYTTSPVSDETPYLFNAPNYLINLSKMVKEHKDADIMVIRANYPYDQFDPNDDYSEDQLWRMVTYDWTDANHDGRLWTDKDHDGTVDSEPSAETNIDGQPIPNFKKSEVEKGEYERFTYINQSTNAYTNIVRQPAKRMDDGLFVGFAHSATSAAIPRTTFHFEVEFYKNQDWRWVTTPTTARGSFTASIKVPQDTPYGLYEGAVVVRNDRQESVVPVSVNVAATLPQAADGSIGSPLTFGGAAVDRAQRDQLYNNGSVVDAKDWGWRAESGDWRFYYYDVPKAPPAGTKFLVSDTFAGPSPHNDIDSLVFGPIENSYQLVGGSDPIYAPYALGPVGGSQNTNTHDGVWQFDTATGTNRELVSAPASQGLHALVQHEVNFQHDQGEVHLPFEATVGGARVAPDSVDQTTSGDTGSFDVDFTTGIDLDGLTADAFGLSQPSTTTETAEQDDPDDPSSASVKRTFTLDHAGSLTVSSVMPGNDLDMYLVYDANKDGAFTSDEIIGSSAGATGTESVSVANPQDGSYQVWMQGYSVSGTPTFPLTVDAVQGHDLTVTGLPSGPVPAGTTVPLHVTYSKTMTAGQAYQGLVQVGPPEAPGLLSVPVTIRRQ
jgi:subtilisin family serine protease